MKYALLALVVASLAGCSTQAERLAKCEAQGVSRDACYIADQNRQATINAAAEKQALENAANDDLLGDLQHAQAAKKPSKQACDSVATIYKGEGLKGLGSDNREVYNRCFPDHPVSMESTCEPFKQDPKTGDCVVEQKAQAAKKERVYNLEGVQVVIKADGNVTVNQHLAALDENTPKAKVYSSGLYTVIVYSSGKVALNESGVFQDYMKLAK